MIRKCIPDNNVYISYREDDIIKPPILTKGDVLNNRYRINKIIAKGSIGDVYLAKDKIINSNVALKIINMFCKPAKERLVHEKLVYDSIEDTACIVKCLGLDIAEYNGVCIMFLVKEYGSPGNLYQWLSSYSSKQDYRQKYGLQIFDELCENLVLLDKQGVVVNDLTPMNVVKNNGKWKFCDLGLGSIVSKGIVCNVSTDLYGTPIYMSPEAFQSESFSDLDHKSDVYSMIVMLYQIQSKDIRPPFYAETFDEMARLHCAGSYVRLTNVEEYINKVIDRGLDKNDRKRYLNIKEVMNDISNNPIIVKEKQTIQRYELGQNKYDKGDYYGAAAQLKLIASDHPRYTDAMLILQDIDSREKQVNDIIPEMNELISTKKYLKVSLLYDEYVSLYPDHKELRPIKAKLNVMNNEICNIYESFTQALALLNMKEVESALKLLKKTNSRSDKTIRAELIVSKISDVFDDVIKQLKDESDYGNIKMIQEKYEKLLTVMLGDYNVPLDTNTKLLT